MWGGVDAALRLASHTFGTPLCEAAKMEHGGVLLTAAVVGVGDVRE